MKILMINSVCGIRSTGRICTELADKYIADGHIVKVAYGREQVPDKYKEISMRISNNMDVYFSALKARLLDNEGFNNISATKRFLRWADEYNPDLLWLHNLHGYYINLDLLFRWIKSRPNMQVKWTLHDCWAFTGHCAYFTFVKCEKWKENCYNCVQKRQYPKSIFCDNSRNNFKRKKELFLGISNMTIVTVSHWLENLVKQSFLKEYPIEVQYNTINTKVFKPTVSDFRQKNGLKSKKIVLGVASFWSDRKGLGDFIKLAEMLDDNYAIVMVGLSKKQLKHIPRKIMGFTRTNNVKELVEIYSAADVFVNPSRQETFGLTTLEAISCGTPAIVYQDTACEEVVNMYGGIAVSQNIESLYEAIMVMIKRDKLI